MKKLAFLTAAFLTFVLTQSCQKTELLDPYEGKPAPTLPTKEMFFINLSEFDQFNGPTDDAVVDRTVNNFSHAAGNVFVWNTLLTIPLILPTLAFEESFNHDPVYQGMGVWLWSYQFTDNAGGIYQAELYGELLVNDEVKWDMYISKVGSFSHVHWYTGIVAIDNSYANWTLNFDPYDTKPFMNIQYQQDNGSGVASIRYTNVIPGDLNNGSYIEYKEGDVVPGEYDRGYDVFIISNNNLLEINWNSILKNGRVKDPLFFGDDNWHCWDNNLQDVNC